MPRVGPHGAPPPSRSRRHMPRLAILVTGDERHGQRLERAGVHDALMRPVPAVELLELPQACSRWDWFQFSVWVSKTGHRLRESEPHLVSEPADVPVGPSRRCPGQERQAPVGSQGLAQVRDGHLPARIPVSWPVPDQEGPLIRPDQAGGRGGIARLQQRHPLHGKRFDFGTTIHGGSGATDYGRVRNMIAVTAAAGKAPQVRNAEAAGTERPLLRSSRLRGQPGWRPKQAPNKAARTTECTPSAPMRTSACTCRPSTKCAVTPWPLSSKPVQRHRSG